MEFVEDLETYCEFGDERVYLLVALAREKDQTEAVETSPPVLREVVEDRRGLARAVAKLDHAARRFDARYRLYLTVNARDVTRAFFELRAEMDEWLRMRLGGNETVLPKFKRIHEAFLSVLQSDPCRDDSKFLFDLDDVSADRADAFRRRLTEYTTVSAFRETPNGFHVVTDPFDYTAFDADLPFERKSDGMVFLAFVGE